MVGANCQTEKPPTAPSRIYIYICIQTEKIQRKEEEITKKMDLAKIEALLLTDYRQQLFRMIK